MSELDPHASKDNDEADDSQRTPPRRIQSRKELQLQSLVGFLGFFAAVAFVQAVINVLSPDPKVWPAALALVLVIAAATATRAWLHYRDEH